MFHFMINCSKDVYPMTGGFDDEKIVFEIILIMSALCAAYLLAARAYVLRPQRAHADAPRGRCPHAARTIRAYDRTGW